MFNVITINDDKKRNEFYWENVKAFENEWNNGINFPNLDDELVYANIDGNNIIGDTFEDVITYLKKNCGLVENACS